MKTYKIVTRRREVKFEIADGGVFWFTSDTHYGHGNIMRYCQRPFFVHNWEKEKLAKEEKFKVSLESIANMNEELVRRINEKVRPQDVLFHLGDFAWHGLDTCREFSEKIICKNRHLIWGNHDDAGMEEFFTSDYDQALVLLPSGAKMHMNHYPHDSWEASHRGVWHLYGHVHGVSNSRRSKVPEWALSLDVGVDSNNFYPWSEKELAAYFKNQQPIFLKSRAEMKDKELGGMTPTKR